MENNRLLKKLKTTKFSLVVSLPENTYEMAKAAWESGADAIKVHINFWHRASGHTFGSLEDNREVFEKILRDCPVPVGIVPGDNTFDCEKNIVELKKMGFDFISLFGHHTPSSLSVRKDLSNFFAVNYTYTYDEINFITDSPFLDMLEMSICLPESYGERLNGRDLARYRYISKNSKVPTIVPTQHYVLPSDIPALMECGVSALMIGAIVTTNDVEGVRKTTKAFREEIDKLIK